MDESYFEKIPLWNSQGPAFEVFSDEISGRVPATRLERWQDFSELLETIFFNRPKTQLVFRGHRRHDWGLEPTLARVTESGVIDQELAASQLDYFRRAVRGRLSDTSLVSADEEDELWAVGQHHGLMTPLLDWTYSPYVALFFAFFKEDSVEEKDNPYRAVYVLNKSFVADDDLCPDIRMFEPRKDNHGRLVNQAGLFTFSPYNSTIENTLADTLSSEDFADDELRNASEEEQPNILAKYICKIYIKNEDREGCIRHLRRMNVHHASLFPDLIGASEYCNLMVAEERRQYELDQSEKRAKIEVEEKESSPRPSFGTVYVADDPDTPVIAAILENSCDRQVEPGRIQLIAENITRDTNRLKAVDWTQRESIQSQMRSIMRIILRKYGYPPVKRDEAIAAIMKYLIDAEIREL
jgi:hypothetical protein